MSEIDSEFIKRGFWINWSKGRVFGATLTLDNTSGAVFIALLAALTSLGIDHLWNIILFILHQSRAAHTTGDGIFQQYQVLIRTLPTPFLLLTDSIRIAWAWRATTTSQRLSRGFWMVLMASAFGIASLAAVVFSSYVVEMSNLQVLVSQGQCFTDLNPTLITSLKVPDWLGLVLQESLSYTKSCYTGTGVRSGCDVFVQPRIPFTQENTTCPFLSADICIASGPASVTFDSQYINSNDVLGINDSPGNRILFRRRTIYTPVRTDRYLVMLDADHFAPHVTRRKPLSGEEGFIVNLGSAVSLTPSLSNNATWAFSFYRANTTFTYTMGATVHHSDYPLVSTFLPVPEISLPNSDTALIMISSNSIYSEVPIDDPVFASHQKLYCLSPTFNNCSRTRGPGLGFTYFSADNPLGIIVASQQYQVCLPDSSGNPVQCTDFTGGMYDRIPELLPQANNAQRATLNFIALLSTFFDLTSLTLMYSVRASRDVVLGVSPGLPNDQWILEAQEWESFIWATFQTILTKRAQGFNDSSGWLVPPSNASSRRFCESQKVLKTGGFANISVFGLCLVVVLSATLMVADAFLLNIVVFLQGTRVFSTLRIQRWIQDGVLQLQRRAYEADGIGDWRWKEKEIPILLDQDVLPSLLTTKTWAASSTGPSSLIFANVTGSAPDAEPNDPATEFSSRTQLRPRPVNTTSTASDSIPSPFVFTNSFDDHDESVVTYSPARYTGRWNCTLLV